jgi:hypothetical protein
LLANPLLHRLLSAKQIERIDARRRPVKHAGAGNISSQKPNARATAASHIWYLDSAGTTQRGVPFIARAVTTGTEME